MNDETVDKELLEKEYFYLQSEIEGLDGKSLTIKAWSVSVAGGIAGASGFTEDSTVILFAALVSLMFWFVDTSWKTFQNANYRRVNEIEKYMNGEVEDFKNLQIAASWRKSYHEDKQSRFFRILFWPHVILPHGTMFVLLLIIYMKKIAS